MTYNDQITEKAIKAIFDYIIETGEVLTVHVPLCESYETEEKLIYGMIGGVGIPHRKGGFFYHPIDKYYFYLQIDSKARKDYFFIVTTLPEPLEAVIRDQTSNLSSFRANN